MVAASREVSNSTLLSTSLKYKRIKPVIFFILKKEWFVQDELELRPTIPKMRKSFCNFKRESHETLIVASGGFLDYEAAGIELRAVRSPRCISNSCHFQISTFTSMPWFVSPRTIDYPSPVNFTFFLIFTFPHLFLCHGSCPHEPWITLLREYLLQSASSEPYPS